MPSITLTSYECSRDLLPDVCAVCGAPATVRKPRQYSWYPGWVWILILINLLVVLIVALILTKRMRVRMPVCDAHEGYWRRRASAATWAPTLVVLALGVGAVVYVATLPPGADDGLVGWLCGGWLLVFVLWIVIAAIIQASSIRATEIPDRTLTLAGLHEEFVAAVMEDRARDRDEDRYRRYGDERDDFDDDPDDRPTRRRLRDDDEDDRRPRRPDDE